MFSRKAIQLLTMNLQNHFVLNPGFKMMNTANRLQLPNKVLDIKMTNDHALICHTVKQGCAHSQSKRFSSIMEHIKHICKHYLILIHSG